MSKELNMVSLGINEVEGPMVGLAKEGQHLGAVKL